MIPTFCELLKYLGMSSAFKRRSCQFLSLGPFVPDGIGTGDHPRLMYLATASALLTGAPCGKSVILMSILSFGVDRCFGRAGGLGLSLSL
jgi:hypothetical protein